MCWCLVPLRAGALLGPSVAEVAGGSRWASAAFTAVTVPACCAQVMQARERGLFVVSPAWLECSCILWKRAQEERYPVPP